MQRKFDAMNLELPKASNSARIGAYVIDISLNGIFEAGLSSLGIGSGTNGFFFIAYLVLCHGLSGQTLGKKLCGIKVISTEQRPLSLRQLLLRETIYRILSFLTIIGILRAFFVRDGATLHDYLAKTTVVSVHAGQRDEMSLGARLALTFGSIAAIVIGALYIMLYTSFPLRSYASQMRLAGIEVEGISGSIMRGMSIERLAYSDKKGRLQLEALNFSMDVAAAWKGESFRIRNLSIAKGNMEVFSSAVAPLATPLATPLGKDQLERTKNQRPNSLVDSDATTADENPEQRRNFQSIEVDQIDISDFAVVIKDREKTLHLDRFFISSFVFSKDGLSISRVYIKSPSLLLDMPDIVFKDKQLSLGNSRFVVSRELFPDILRKDFDLNGSMDLNLEKKEISSIHIEAFERRVQLSTESLRTAMGSSLAVQVYGFTPGTYFEYASPISNISLKGSLDLKSFMPRIESASFNVHSVLFESQDGMTFQTSRSGQSFEVALNPFSVLSANPVLIITGPQADESIEWLSRLYFEKPYTQLAQEERAVIDVDKKIFRSPALNRIPAATSSAPTSTKQNDER